MNTSRQTAVGKAAQTQWVHSLWYGPDSSQVFLMTPQTAPIRWLIYESPHIQVRVIGPAAAVGDLRRVHDASEGIASCVYVGGRPDSSLVEPDMAPCLGGPFDGDEQPVPEILLGTMVVRPVLAICGTDAQSRISAYRWDWHRFIYDPRLTAELRG